MSTSNPVFGSNAFKTATWDQLAQSERRSSTMTVQGTVTAALILVSLTIASAFGSWVVIEQKVMDPQPLLLCSVLGAFLTGIILLFVPRAAPVLAPIYAVTEGALLGALSLFVGKMLDARLHTAGAGEAVVFQAFVLTVGVLAGLLVAYGTRLIRVTSTAAAVISAIAFAACMFLIGLRIASWCGADVSHFYDTSPLSIGLSAVMVVVSALMLLRDFHYIEEFSKMGVPKYMEWYTAYGLLVSLIWLYVNILSLLSKIKER